MGSRTGGSDFYINSLMRNDDVAWARVACVVTRAKNNIIGDIQAGTVPEGVGSFAELHDYVDANEYVEEAFIFLGNEATNIVISEVDAWIQRGMIQ